MTHTAIKLNFDGLGPNEKIKTAIRPIIKIGYGSFCLSYTIMNYKDNYNESYNASSFGICFMIPIPGKNWKS